MLENPKLNKKTNHFKSSEELYEAKSFANTVKSFNLKKLAFLFLWDCLRAKKQCEFEILTKNLKICRKILDFFQISNPEKDPNDSSFLVNEFSDPMVKNLNIIYRILYIQTQTSIGKFDCHNETIQLTNYAKHMKIEWLSYTANLFLIQQYVSSGRHDLAYDLVLDIFESVVPEFGLKKDDFSPNQAQYWSEILIKKYLEGKYNNSIEQAKEIIYGEVETFEKNKSDMNVFQSVRFAVKCLDMVFQSVLTTKPLAYTTFAFIYLVLSLENLEKCGVNSSFTRIGQPLARINVSCNFFLI